MDDHGSHADGDVPAEKLPVMLTLGYHLEMVIWEDAGEGTRMNAAEVMRRTANATDEQLARAEARLGRVRAEDERMAQAESLRP